MTFRFQPSDETVESAVRRIACAELDVALAAIRDTSRPPGRVVHEVRRRCKALRGLIRLVRPVFPAFAAENAALRDIARQLAGVRDGAVLADTLTGLAGNDAVAVSDRLPRHHADAEAVRAALEGCAAPLLAARVRAATWMLTDDGWDALAPGFIRTVKAARLAMKGFLSTRDADAAHAWRKQVKYHWQHMRLLRGIAPEPAEKRAKRAVKLSDLLGERHDLDLLLEALAALPVPEDDADAIERLTAEAHRRIAVLDDEAIRLGKRLLGKKPRKLALTWQDLAAG